MVKAGYQRIDFLVDLILKQTRANCSVFNNTQFHGTPRLNQPAVRNISVATFICNFLVGGSFQTYDQPGTFKWARSRCKTCPFIHNAEKMLGPKRSNKITDPFTCTSANVIYCITYVMYLLQKVIQW